MGLSEFAQDDPFGMKSLGLERGNNEFRGVDPNGNLQYEGDSNSYFGEVNANNFQARGQRLGQTEDHLRGQMMGQNSLSAEQLRQGLQQNRAAQMSAAAGARPSNAALAGRTAAIQMGRLGAGLSGQQAIAGIAERNAAANALGNVQLGARQQDLGAYNAAKQNALTAYGGIESARAQRYGALANAPTKGEMIVGGLQGLGSMIATKSDIRSKQNISSGDGDAEQLLEGLKAYSYDYKPTAQREEDIRQSRLANRKKSRANDLIDSRAQLRSETQMPADDVRFERKGYLRMPADDLRPKHLGIMAQDLEKSPIGAQAVMNTPTGKSIDPGQLTVGLAAGLANLHKRLKQVEGK